MAYTEYLDQVQKAYLAYYQRPADPAGQVYWAQRLEAANGNLDGLMGSFAYSEESGRLYGEINNDTIGDVVDAFYQAMFHREAEAEGKAFYVDGFKSGKFNAGTIALDIINGALNDDAVSIMNKMAAANFFTQAIDPDMNGEPPYMMTYDAADEEAARDWLHTITFESETRKTQSQVVTDMKNLIANAGDPIFDVADGFVLTNDTDIAVSNIFTAGLVYTPGGNDRINSLQDEDVLTGSGVNPTLNATLGNANDNGGTVITPKLIGIETINVAFTGSGGGAVTDLDLQDATGAKHINITRVSQATNIARIENIKDVLESMSVARTNANETGTVEFSFGVGTLRGENTADLKVSDVQLGTLNIGRNTSGVNASGVSIEGYEHLNLNSTGADNYIGTLNLPMDTGTNGSIVITGDQNLTLGETIRVVNGANNTVESIRYQNGIQMAFGRLALIDASQFGADLTLYIDNGMLTTDKADTSGVRQDVSILGGAGDDTFILADQVEAGDSIDGGDGTDTLIVTRGGIVNADSSVITSVEHVEVRGDAAATITVDFDKLPDANLIFVRNEGAAPLVPPVPLTEQPAAATLITNLNNLTAAQAAALKTEHSNTGSNGITQNIINANLKDATGNNDLVALTIDDGYNTDPLFNLTLNAANVENITIADNDTESNSIHLGTFAQTTGTLTFTGGQTGKFMNLDTDAANANGLSGYQLVETGAVGSYNSGLLAAAVDTVLNAFIRTADYRALDDGATADVRLISQNIIAADYASDLIVRLGDVTRTDGVSSQSITGGTGNDTFIFDAQGVNSAGYTSGDTVAGGASTDTLVIDGNFANAISVRKSEWDNTSGIDVLRLAGNQAMAATGAVVDADPTIPGHNISYYIELDDAFVHQTDSGNNLLIISNDGDLNTNNETNLVLNLRALAQNANVTFVGANGNAATAGTIASNRVMVEDNSANALNKLDGGDSNIFDLGAGNNNVLHIFNSADVTINDLANTKNFSTITFENDRAIAQTLNLTLNNAVVDQLVDSYHVADLVNKETLFINAIDNIAVPLATAALNVNAAAVGAQFTLNITGAGGADTIVAGAGDDIITGGAGVDTIRTGLGNDTIIYGASATQLVNYIGTDTNTNNIDKILDFTAVNDTIQFTSGAANMLAGITLVAGTTGFSVNENNAVLISAAPIAIAAGAANITALTTLMEAAAGGVASTAGAAGAATGIQAYTFETAAGAGAFDGKTYLVINDGTAALDDADVIIEITGATGNISAANFTIV